MSHPSSMAGLAAVVARAAEIAEQRERCPRAARLSDAVQAELDRVGPVRSTANNEEALLYHAYLEGASAFLARDLANGKEITEDDERYVTERIAKGGL